MKIEITPSIVRELLHYNPDTGVFVWRKRAMKWFSKTQSWRTWNARYAGKEAGYIGTLTKYGYQCRLIRVLGRSTLGHRLAWIYMTEDALPAEIDHINRDATDNRWSNLRPATRAENNRNRSLSTSNTSGVTGVIWEKRHRRWRADGKINGKTKYLGEFRDINEAAKAVAAFRAKHGFDPDHGAKFAHYSAH